MKHRAALAAALTVCLASAAVGQTDAAAGRASAAVLLDEAAVDRLLSTMTDAEVRQFLHDELHRQVDAPPGTQPSPFAETINRVSMLAATATSRLRRWTTDLLALPERAPAVEARLAAAPHGVAAMAGAFALLAAAGLSAALATARAARPAGLALRAGRPGYAGRLARTLALTAVELAPVVAFVAATLAAAPLLRGALGPMWDYVWIWHAGLSAGWTVRVAARRLFAADAPALRIAALDDDAARTLDRVVAVGAAIAVGGWLLAGLFPTFDAGIGPAILTVLAAGTAVAVLLIGAAIVRRRAIRDGALRILAPRAESRARPDGDMIAGPAAMVAAAAAPWLMAAYVAFGWAWWAAHWLEDGVQRLAGPLGSILVIFGLPAFERGAQELSRTLAGRGETGLRLQSVLHGALRSLIGLAAIFVVSALWGLDLARLVAGPEAAPWARAAFLVAVTVLAAVFAWKLIVAVLPDTIAETQATGDEGGGAATHSRGGTLRPLLRSFLKVTVAAAAAMALLSDIGVDVAPLLASAGILGIAIGFGAQTLVRDVFSGIFFLVDDAFRIGEYIELDDKLRGQVAAISVRSLQLRHHLGAVITVPFGELRNITNHSRDWAIYKMLFRVETDTDPAHVKRIVKKVGAELLADPEHGPNFLEPLKSQGVSMIDDDSALVIRVKFRCRPGRQFVLRREVYHRLTRAFADEGVRLARRKVEVVGGGPLPVPAALGAAALEPEAEPSEEPHR